ncbi:MAG TPA: class I SAM-dependent methyltransferase [Tepidisphaeraceae bacterium]|jgi:2-polyprenyl-3-methyl-5-hydroxy-6-metoxy-1,4-benzoquinol methylase|nr:class I SAM-dependent methyltransferase [Tepidisphaeraceae bacterium]
MCTACAPAIDTTAVDAFAEKLIGMVNGAALMLMTSIGHRTGLFDTMGDGVARTSTELAEKAGLSERYVREWLGAMTTGGIVELNTATRQYTLPAAHAALLTRAARPNNFGVTAQWVGVLASVEDEVVDAFSHGRGVPYSAYNRFHEVMADESDQTVVAALSQHILPLVPGLPARLEQGIDVFDVACGSGRALCEMAEAYPNSRFVGYDTSPEAIAAAKREADRLKLTNVTFEARSVSDSLGERRFDLVTAFDAIHDQAKPETVLANIKKSLKPGGALLMQDILGSSHVEQDIAHPIGPYLYTVSCMHCMSVSLANGGPGLGAMWGKDVALRMLGEAGFGDVQVHTLSHDISNYYYIAEAGK